jgi:hypothetical protein
MQALRNFLSLSLPFFALTCLLSSCKLSRSVMKATERLVSRFCFYLTVEAKSIAGSKEGTKRKEENVPFCKGQAVKGGVWNY